MLRSLAFETHANVFPCVTVFDAKKTMGEWSELILSWKDIDFLLFYDFVAEIYKKRTEINGIKLK